MKLGYFTMPLHPPGRNYAETLAEDREAIILADQLGFNEAYVGEHVTDIAETVTDTFTDSPTPLGSDTVTPTFSDSPTPTDSSTATATPSATPSATASSTATLTATVTATPTVSPTPTATQTVTPARGQGTASVSPGLVLVNSTGNTFQIVYTGGAAPFTNGKLVFTIPAGWTPPVTAPFNSAGYVRAIVTGGTLGGIAINGLAVTVTVSTLAANTGTVTLNYGDTIGGGPGVTAPGSAQTAVFGVASDPQGSLVQSNTQFGRYTSARNPRQMAMTLRFQF